MYITQHIYISCLCITYMWYDIHVYIWNRHFDTSTFFVHLSVSGFSWRKFKHLKMWCQGMDLYQWKFSLPRGHFPLPGLVWKRVWLSHGLIAPYLHPSSFDAATWKSQVPPATCEDTALAWILRAKRAEVALVPMRVLCDEKLSKRNLWRLSALQLCLRAFALLSKSTIVASHTRLGARRMWYHIDTCATVPMAVNPDST